jgi:hypothetical protein
MSAKDVTVEPVQGQADRWMWQLELVKSRLCPLRAAELTGFESATAPNL